jgi:hypothetical protein
MVSEDRKNEMTTDTFLKSQRITRIKTNKNNYLCHSCHSRNSLNHWLILFAITFLSCQSVPKTTDMFPDDAGFIPLEPGARIYMVIDVQNARPILNNLNFININNQQFQQMLDQTRFAAAAVYQTKNLRSYRLAAWGSYPVSRAKMALGASKDWKKQRSAVAGDDYWYSPGGGLSIAITTGRAFAAAVAGNAPDTSPNTIPNTIIDPFSAAPGTAIPEGFNEFRKGAVLSCWIDSPGPAINQKLGEMGIPLELPAQQIFVSLLPVDDRTAENPQYVARLQIQLPGASQARALTMMFAFARSFLPPQSELSILFANPPVQDDNALNITTSPLSAREISLLFALFSL